jgi:YD repeat-containing protein
MFATPEVAVRELDHRTGDGIEVRLMWNPRTNRVSVVVEDRRSGPSLEFEVDAANALAAFHHPFAYAYPNGDQADRALAA